MTGAERLGPVERFVAFTRRNPMIVDGVLAVVLFLVALQWTLEGKVPRDTRALAIVVAVLATAPVVYRRRNPIPAAAVTAVVAAAGTFTFSGTLAAYVLPALIMGYSAVAYGPRWAGRLVAAVMAVGMFGPLLLTGLFVTDREGGWIGSILVAGYLLLVLVCVLLLGATRRASDATTSSSRNVPGCWRRGAARRSGSSCWPSGHASPGRCTTSSRTRCPGSSPRPTAASTRRSATRRRPSRCSPGSATPGGRRSATSVGSWRCCATPGRSTRTHPTAPSPAPTTFPRSSSRFARAGSPST
ncbi:hypothetical protein BJF90_12210 [Pseudonocardia sp. CNS-004]|nr:hypothetical protein BJF90_12210 [Pseudonocardia sp. CNS-004]